MIVPDSFTNRELAENRTWLATLAYLECPFCHFLSHCTSGLSEISASCPNCGASGKPRLCFPDLSSHRLLEMIVYFYARACERLADTQNELLRTISEQLGRHFDWGGVARTVVAVHKFRRTKGMTDTAETFEQMLGTIQISLSLNSPEDARTIFPSLLGYSDTTKEHEIIVLLAAAMLEKLFKSLLSSILTTDSLNGSTAKHNVKKSQGHISREKLFAKFTGESLKTAITTIGSPEFYSKWQSTRNARNEFMHGSSFAIGANAAEEAFEVAKDSFVIFAELNNKFCVHKVAIPPTPIT
jgi:hypothetical protein